MEVEKQDEKEQRNILLLVQSSGLQPTHLLDCHSNLIFLCLRVIFSCTFHYVIITIKYDLLSYRIYS